MNIFQTLREDHDKQRHLVNSLVETHGDHKIRRAIFEALKAELESHAIAEEKYFYVPLIEDGRMQGKARHGIAEHHEMDELIECLETMNFSSSGWLVKAKCLSEKIHHHLDDEEHEFFQQAGKILNESEKAGLAKEFLNQKSISLKNT